MRLGNSQRHFPTILHETNERLRMEQGMPYHAAHPFALQAEWEQRHSQTKTARYKLSRRMTFRGLQISIETDKGEKRHWYDPHNKEHGTTTMKYPYGYIRRTEGVDGDHIDVYVGPNEDAKNVYVVHQMKAPDFKKFDEDKCMLGFDTLEDAKKAYLAHYNDTRFLGSITTMPFDEFKKKVMKTFDHPQKIAEIIALIKQGNLRNGMKRTQTSEQFLPFAEATKEAVARRAGYHSARPVERWPVNTYLKRAYDSGVQCARAKFAQHTGIPQQRQKPVWGLDGTLPSGFKAPPPPELQRKPMTTQTNNTKATGKTNTQSGAPPGVGSTTNPTYTTAAGVSGQQHAWNQQAGRMSAGKAQANIAADQAVASVVSRGNREMGEILRDTSGNPGAPPALTGTQMTGARGPR